MQMQKRKILLAVFFCLILLLSVLSGCTAMQDESQQPVLSQNNAQLPEDAEQLTHAEVMQMKRRTVDVQQSDYIHSATAWTVRNGVLWIAGTTPRSEGDAPESYAHTRQLLAVDPQTDTVEHTEIALPEYHPAIAERIAALDGQTEYFAVQNVYNVFFDADGERYLVLSEVFSCEETGEEQQHYTLCTLDESGSLVRRTELILPQDMVWNMSAPILCTAADTFWTSFYVEPENATRYIGQWSFERYSLSEGNAQVRVDLPGNVQVCSYTKEVNGGILVLGVEFSAQDTMQALPVLYQITEVDSEAPKVERLAALPMEYADRANMWQLVFSADGIVDSNELLLCDAVNGIYRRDASGNLQQILKWSDYAVDAMLGWQMVYALSPQQFVLVVPQGSPVVLTIVEDNVIGGADTLTLAVVGEMSNDLLNLVNRYNTSEAEKYLRVVQYTDIDAQHQGMENAYRLLEREIINGNIPDILYLPGNAQGANLVRKGLMRDLYEFLDNDPELAREDFIPNVLQSFEMNGALPFVAPGFIVSTVTGSAERLGGALGWSWEEYQTVMDENPQAIAFFGQDRSTVLTSMTMQSGDRFVDQAAGTCSFNTPDFIRLLEASAQYPQQKWDATVDPKPYFSNGQALLYMDYIGTATAMVERHYMFDGEVVFKGAPMGAGVGGAIQIAESLGITASCKDPEAAWAFVRMLLLSTYQDTLKNRFPLRQDSLDACLEASMQRREQPGIPIYLFATLYANGNTGENALSDAAQEYWTRGASAEDVKQIRELIYSAESLSWFDPTITGIMLEEADYFYNGVRSAEEAAALMQSRVQTYLAEQG